MKKRLCNSILVLATIVIGLSISVTMAANDADLIPPEVLKQMDPDIRSGKRPTFATIRQGDIFGLRQNPKFKEDFVRFDFDVTKLSTVQNRIVENWIRSGYNPVYMVNEDFQKYSLFLKPSKFLSSSTSKTSLLRHSVNTDCGKVSFQAVVRHDRGVSYRDRYYYWLACFAGVTEEWSVIAEAGGGNAVAGSFPLGEGRIVFMSTPSGTDARRWTLNFWHWAMGLGVPGAADTSIAGAGAAESGLTLREVKKYDSIVLKNGDTVTGIIENKNFTVKSSYGTVPFESSKIAKIVFEGSGSNVDVIRLKVGDKLSGVVQDEKITVKLVSGTSIDLAKDKVKEINIRREK